MRQRLSIRIAYGWMPFTGETRSCSCESSNLRDPFAVNVSTRTHMYVVLLHVLAIHQHTTASIRDRCTARGHTCYNTKFCEEKIHDQKTNHEIHKILCHENFELYGM